MIFVVRGGHARRDAREHVAVIGLLVISRHLRRVIVVVIWGVTGLVVIWIVVVVVAVILFQGNCVMSSEDRVNSADSCS